MGIKTYCLCEVKETTNSGYYRFYDTGFSNYKFIALLPTGELVYANSISFVADPIYKNGPLCRHIGMGVIHDVLSYKRPSVDDLSLMMPYKEELLNRRSCIIEYTPEGDRNYGKLLSVEQLKKEFNW